MNKALRILLIIALCIFIHCDIKGKASVNHNIFQHVSIKRLINKVAGHHHEINQNVGPLRLSSIDIRDFNEDGQIQLHRNGDELEIIFVNYHLQTTARVGFEQEIKFLFVNERIQHYGNIDYGIRFSLHVKINYANDKPQLISAHIHTEGMQVAGIQLPGIIQAILNPLLKTFENLIQNLINDILNRDLVPKINEELTKALNFKIEIPLMEEKKLSFSLDKLKQLTNGQNQWILGAIANASVESNYQISPIEMNFSQSAYDKLGCVFFDGEMLVSLMNYAITNPFKLNKLEATVEIKRVEFVENEAVNIILEFELKTSKNSVKKEAIVSLKSKPENGIMQYGVSILNLDKITQMLLKQANAEEKISELVNKSVADVTSLLANLINDYKRPSSSNVKFNERITNENVALCIDI